MTPRRRRLLDRATTVLVSLSCGVLLTACAGPESTDRTPGGGPPGAAVPAGSPSAEAPPATLAPAPPAPAQEPATPKPSARPAAPGGRPIASGPAASPTPSADPTATPAPTPSATPAPAASPSPAAPAASAPAVADPGGPVAVSGSKPGATRVGVQKCGVCHKRQRESWAASAHARRSPPLDCESCHGPGSEYVAMAVMKDAQRARAAGLVLPQAAFCQTCHQRHWLADMLQRVHAHKAPARP